MQPGTPLRNGEALRKVVRILWVVPQPGSLGGGGAEWVGDFQGTLPAPSLRPLPRGPGRRVEEDAH